MSSGKNGKKSARKNKADPKKIGTKGTRKTFAERAAKIHDLLISGIYPDYERIAKENGYSLRTAKRDVQFIRDALHKPIAHDYSRGGMYYSEQGVESPVLGFTEREVIAMCLSGQALEACHGTSFAPAMVGMNAKIYREVSALINVTPERIAESFSFGRIRKPPSLNPDLFEAVAWAVIYGEVLEFWYSNFPKMIPREREVHPLHLVFQDHAWTLVAYDPYSGQIKSFVLSRAARAKRTGKGFVKTSAHEFRKYLENSIGTYLSGPVEDIRLRVTPAGHQLLLERPPHPSQKLTEVVDGWAEQTMRTTINIELVNYILNFGRDVIVLEPASLQDMVGGAVDYLSGVYKELAAARRQSNTGAAGVFS